MRFIALIEEPVAIEKILRHLNLWCGPATFSPARPPPLTSGRGPVSEIPLSAHDGEFLIETSSMPRTTRTCSPTEARAADGLRPPGDTLKSGCVQHSRPPLPAGHPGSRLPSIPSAWPSPKFGR